MVCLNNKSETQKLKEKKRPRYVNLEWNNDTLLSNKWQVLISKNTYKNLHKTKGPSGLYSGCGSAVLFAAVCEDCAEFERKQTQIRNARANLILQDSSF